MGRFDLTRTQERWTLGGLCTVVVAIGAFIVLRRPSALEPDPQGATGPSIAAPLEPGTYALTGASWMAAGQTIPSGRHLAPPAPEDGRETGEPAVAERRLPPALEELEGMPISVGGR
jgi:hypothetical protein